MKMRGFVILCCLMSVAMGCSQANTRGSSVERNYAIEIDNSGLLVMYTPLDVTASTEGSTEQTPSNTATNETRPNVSLAGQGATSSLAADGAEAILKGVNSTLKRVSGLKGNTASENAVKSLTDSSVDAGTSDNDDNEAEEVIPEVSMRFHHYNPESWDGRGSSIVLCPGQHFEECEIDGTPMEKHGALDAGREIWTVRNTPELGGTIVCKDSSKYYHCEVSGSGGMQYGNC